MCVDSSHFQGNTAISRISFAGIHEVCDQLFHSLELAVYRAELIRVAVDEI